MNCTSCTRHKTIATLSGDVCNYCEKYRAECEARHVLLMPKINRRNYLDGVAKKRGAQAGKALEDLVRAVWQNRRTRETT